MSAMRSSRGRLSQTLTVQPFSTGVYPDGKSPALTFTRPPATLSVGRHPLLVFPVLSAMRSSRGQLSQTLTSRPSSAAVCPGGKSPALTFTRPPATLFVGGHPLLVQAQLSAMRSLVGPGFRGCAPMMGAAVVVRNAESGPAPGFRGCVVGRVVEVESVGVRGRTRRPVLDFRPTVGVIVAACAVPATYVAPR